MRDLTIAWSPSSFAAADDAPIRLMKRLGIRVKPNPFGRRLSEDEAVEHVRGVDGLIAGLEPLSRRVLSSGERLKAIARVGIGTDNVDFEAADERGISVSNTPDAPAEAVAELTLAAALALLRGLEPANAAMHRGDWLKLLTPGLNGTPVLLVGFGRIGRAVAKLLSAFGATIMVHDPAFSPEADADVEVESVPLEDGLARAKVVSLHASGRDCLLKAEQFARMPPGTILLNCARGELVDHAALLASLDAGRLEGAWFDVFWEEPYSGPLTGYPQVLLTPHLGTYTGSCRREMEMQATLNLLRDLGVEAQERP